MKPYTIYSYSIKQSADYAGINLETRSTTDPLVESVVNILTDNKVYALHTYMNSRLLRATIVSYRKAQGASSDRHIIDQLVGDLAIVILDTIASRNMNHAMSVKFNHHEFELHMNKLLDDAIVGMGSYEQSHFKV